MPLLYHPKESVTKVSFAMNGVSLIPLKHAEQPKSFLYSKNYHTLLKNKSMMIPTNFKEQPPKSAPEKQKPPIMSMFRRMQLEDIRDRTLISAKHHRLLCYISQKFVAKFGSAHKNCIAASVEDFLVDHQSENIDINDLNELDTLIGISINHKKEFQDKELLKSASEGNYLQSTSPSNSLTKSGSQPMFSSPQWREDRQRRNKSSKDRGPIGLDIVEFKLSQKTFKKTVLQKQELYRLNIRNQISEKKQSIHGSSRAGRSTLNSRDNQNAGETGNLNHFTVNKGFFVNRDIEKFTQSTSTF